MCFPQRHEDLRLDFQHQCKQKSLASPTGSSRDSEKEGLEEYLGGKKSEWPMSDSFVLAKGLKEIPLSVWGEVHIHVCVSVGVCVHSAWRDMSYNRNLPRLFFHITVVRQGLTVKSKVCPQS